MPVNEPKIQPLTEAEKEVLKMITEDFLTPKQIQLRRHCSRQAFYKILKKLKQKGALNSGLQQVDKTDAPVNLQPIRLHGQEFNIKILYQDQNYQKALERSNILFLEGHTVKLYRNSIEVYAGEGTSFYGDDAHNAFSKSLVYWKKFFVRLENDLKLILIKPRSQNIRLVNAHYARGESEIYANATEHKEKIKIFAQEDGKLAFITDDSFGFNEDETVHPKTAKPDREEIDKQINDWRLHHPPTNSELAGHIMQVSQNQAHFADQMVFLDKNLETHFGVLKGIQEAITELKETVKDLKKKDL